jgi:hypothetical protein
MDTDNSQIALSRSVWSGLLCDPLADPNLPCSGRTLFRLVAFGLMFAGVFALVQSATGRFLSHDLRFIRMDMEQLCGLSDGRVARFMFHDRVSFGGAIIAIGVLYLWLEQVPLKAGEAWAWWTFLLSGLAGFGSFMAYLGYGYLDSWHGLATLALLPLYIAGLVLSRNCAETQERRLQPAEIHEDPLSCPWSGGVRCLLQAKARSPNHSRWRSRLTIGRALLLATASGLLVGGTTIMLIGMTRVFVSQDLRYIGLGANEMAAINNRLLPLIAHDRAGFGGAIATCGLLLFCCVWFGRPTASLWRAVCVAGSTGFISAIGVHPLIGYTDFSHLAPAYLGAALFSVGTGLSYRPCVGTPTAPPKLGGCKNVQFV